MKYPRKQRLFIAALLPKKTRGVLVKIQNWLKKESGQKVNWVEEGNFHQTILFLGWVKHDEIGRVTEIMKSLEKINPITLTFAKLAFLPDFRRIRAVVILLGGEDERLTRCYHKLRLPLDLAGFEFDTRFSPHITLGKVKRVQAKPIFSEDLVSKIEEYLKENEITFTIDKFVLFESKLSKKGPIYTPIHSVNL